MIMEVAGWGWQGKSAIIGPVGPGRYLAIEWTVDLWQLDQSAVLSGGSSAR
jgi:hypothetical protein